MTSRDNNKRNAWSGGSTKERLIASTLLAGVASLGVPLAVGGIMMAGATDALAQDYSNANLTGTIVDENGAPLEGASVTVTSDAQGFSRTSVTNADGSWRVPQIPQGSYTVVVSRDGYATTTSRNVRVQVGTGNAYEIVMASAGGATGDEIVVTATRQVEFSQTTTGTSVDVAELVEREPIPRNITALALLAPTALPADTTFAVGSAQQLAPASISGASGAENAFFVNGLNITNFINGIGGATVPFDFYQTVEVKTGGYQAEFGRATGGVVNAVTKSGTNDFMLALHGNYSPNSLLEDRPQAVTRDYEGYDQEIVDYTIEAGGPIIPDHLFFYGLANWTRNENATASIAGTYFDNVTDDPFYGAKLDAYLTDDHHFELTWFDTSATTLTDTSTWNPVTNTHGPVTGSQYLAQGGESYVGRYTGAFTDWLTLSGAYGRMEVDQATCNNTQQHALVLDRRTAPTTQLGVQNSAACATPFLAEREFYRADVDIFFDMMGEHHVRFGYDHEDTTMTEISNRNGTGTSIGGRADWAVRRTAGGNAGLGLAAGQEYIERRAFQSGGGFQGSSSALYIQDSWDVTDRLNLSIGWRQDQFEIANPLGQTFMEFDDEQALRLGFSYDVFGDRSGKLYGFFGRYYLPLPSNTAFRIATNATDISEFFLPSGGGLTYADDYTNTADNALAFDPVTGMPVGGLGPQIVGQTTTVPCPTSALIIAAANTDACVVRNNGTAPNPAGLVAQDLQSTYEDEYLIGYQQRLNSDWTAGVSLTYRNLGRVSEDALIDQGIVSYCNRNGIAAIDPDGADNIDGNADDDLECNEIWSGTSAYYIINPGEGAIVQLQTALPGGGADGIIGNADDTLIALTENDLQLTQARREYLGLVFTVNRAFDGVWGLDASYTVSRSEGNFEGALKSDVGQTDAGITEDYDFLSYLPGQYGLLPNHRAHQLKIRGSYAVTEDFLIGGNLTALSGRPYGCIGAAPAGYAGGEGDTANNAYGFQANARFCNNLVVDRGSSFFSDWIYRVDLSFRYDLPENLFNFGNLTLRADVFNVFNEQGVQESWEFGELSYGTPDPRYGQPFAYQTPRSVRFGFDWEF